MLDLHVHVLPGIDDGPRTLEDALALARALANDGIEHIVATPHIYPGVFDNSAALIGEAFNAFQSAVSDAGIDLTMTWAAEVRICPEILEWIELRRLPMLNGSLVGPSTALIELPDGQIPVGTDKLMGLMLERGITPLVAHPERNKAVMEQPTRLEALRRLGCKFQLTAGSVLGDFGSRAQTTAQKLLDAGWVDVIATDAHNLSSRRPRMGAARDWLVQHYDEALALRLTKTQPTDIAGVSSFALQAGGRTLLFRDLPSIAPPLEDTQSWAMNLAFDATGIAGNEPSPSMSPDPAKDHWSLIDFRIDALVADLQSTSLQAGTLMDTPEDRSDLVEEDWLLPTFQPPAASPPPDHRSPRLDSARPEPMVATPAMVEPVMAMPAPATRGLRLSEVAQHESVSPAYPEHAGHATARAGSMAQAGHQTAAVAVPARAVPRVIHPVAPEAPAHTHEPSESRRGFRLSDLKPLDPRRR